MFHIKVWVSFFLLLTRLSKKYIKIYSLRYKTFWSQTALGLTKFLEKNSNIFNPRQFFYENVFNYWFDETSLVI